jgi:hypothetical protein
MKIVSLTHEDVKDIPLVANVSKKKISIFNWHVASIIVYELKHVPTDSWVTSYWLQIGPQGLEFGLHIPVRWKSRLNRA